MNLTTLRSCNTGISHKWLNSHTVKIPDPAYDAKLGSLLDG